MSDDWKEFLKEVREQNEAQIEATKNKESEQEHSCCDGDSCSF